jgi:serine/threonine-protein kinase
MKDDDPRLMELAGKILDGDTIDWDAAPGSASEYVEEFRALGTLAKLGTAPAPGPLGDWGPLRLIERVGEGAFGEVFRAWDTRLDREVALKLLRPVRSQPGHPTTVITEGRLLARVRHPNVVTVFGAEQIDGRIGIWTEFVHGSTLQHIVDTQGPMPVAEAMEVGRVLCAALAAIHEAGVVHGDVKAQNVLREPGGRLVLVDLGTGREHLQGVSAPGGPISGTPLYMAPELWQGEPPTPQSDVYSLGVLLYFLVSGAHPIQGTTAAEVRDAHEVGHDVPLREERPDLPGAFVDVVERARASDRRQRYEHAGALEAALIRAQASLAHPVTRRRRVLVVSATVLAIASGWTMDLGGVRTRLRWAAAGAAPARWDTRPLTITGDAAVADISPDGKIVVYIRTPDRSLWIRNLETGENRVILPVDASDTVWGATMTPDGLSVDALDRNGDLWRVPLEDTGRRRRIATGVRSPPGWSPDGMRMAFISGPVDNTTSSAVVANREAGGARELVNVTRPTDLFGRGWVMFPATNRPAWSPDGRTIAVAGLTMSNPAATAHVALIDVETSARRETTMTQQTSSTVPAILQVAWLDQTRLAVNIQMNGQGPHQLSILDTRTLAWERITNDLSVYKGVFLTRDRKQVVTTRVEERTGIWMGSGSGAGMSVLMPESAAVPSDGTFDSAGNFVYSGATSDGPAVWVLRKGTSTPAFVARGTGPAITPAGDAVLFAKADDKPGLYRAALDGSDVRQLASGAVGKLAISPDSRTVFFIAGDSIWAVPVAGGPPRQLASRAFNPPSVSPDGRHLLYTQGRTDTTTAVFLVCDLPGCTNPREFVKPGWARPRTIMWAPDGKGIAYARMEAPENIWVQPLDGEPIWQLTQFGDDRTILDFSWSPDGSKLAVTRASTLSDAVLLTRDRW